MKEIQLNTYLFGNMNFYAEEGLTEDYIVSLDNKEITLEVCIFENFIMDENVHVVKGFLDHIPLMYQKAKEKILDDYNKNKRIKFFIQCQMEEIMEEDLLEIFEMEDVRQLTPEVFINKLEPRAVSIAQNVNNKIDCSFDFSLNENYTDELLVLCFDENFDIYKITHES